MKKIAISLIFAFLFLSCSYYQKGEVNYRGGIVECLASNIKFKVKFPSTTGLQDLLVSNGQKIFICETSLPVQIEVVDNVTGASLSGGTGHNWTGPIDGAYGSVFEGEVNSVVY